MLNTRDYGGTVAVWDANTTATATIVLRTQYRFIVPSGVAEDEARWDELFASSQDLLAEMADKALVEHRAGHTTPIQPDKL